MRRRVLIIGAGFLSLAALCTAPAYFVQAAAAGHNQGSSPATAEAEHYRAVLDKYCVTCHNSRLRTAGLDLDNANLSNVTQRVDMWEKVATKLRGRDMPPVGRPRPDELLYEGFASWLEASLDAAALAAVNPGRPVLHRLNRTEYANAIRDLLALKVDVATLLPSDDSTHGFDNISDVLGVSPLLMESYVNAARKISRLAIGNPGAPVVSETYRGAHDETQDYHQAGMPFGTRGGLRVQHQFPVDGEYEIRIRLERSHLLQIRGLQESHNLELAIDGWRTELFTLDGGPHMYKQEGYDSPTPALTADDGLRIRVPVKAGLREVVATFPLKTSALLEDLSRPLLISYPGSNDVNGLPGVSSIIITGPYGAASRGNTASRRSIFVCADEKDERSCAETIVSTLARRAYRGFATSTDIQGLLGLYTAGLRRGGFEAGIESALWGILASPKFVFRSEFDPEEVKLGAAYRISDLELASRLSFFLWSSIPDDQLLDIATRGELRNPEVLERQVRRMLADPRANALVDNFAGQWLYLRNISNIRPNPKQFPNFDNNLRRAFRRETELLFSAILREDRSILDLLNADYTFVNERLARHYGIPNVYGDDFRRVSVTDENRRGLLGHGSILMVTSYANRTSPVLRGKWVLENVLGSPPPPPPPNVPDLAEKTAGKVLTIRERMAEHRANPVCASCHAKMDPLGFGLENFDAVGGWREREDQGTPIDATGTLPDGTTFNGVSELRRALAARSPLFVRTVTTKLLTYALGRGLEYYDASAVRQIVRNAARQDNRFSTVILGIVRSVPFQMRQAVEPTGPVANR
jgi:mono/diheme cytochrome c family protein